MAANAGLSVKERLALLQNSSGNTSNTTTSTTKPAAEPIRYVPGVKPKPSTEAPKPPGDLGLKSATPSNPAIANNKPITPNKPALTVKPGTAAKPFTVKTGTDEAQKTNGTDKPQFPKLRPVGTQPGKVTHSGSNKSNPPSPETGGAGEEAPPTESAKSNSSHSELGGSDSSSPVEMKEKTCFVTPLKPVSVQERLAALRKKSLGGDSMDSKSKENDKGSTSPKSSFTLSNKSPSVLSPSSLKPVNEPKTDSTGSKPDFAAIKPSDIAKSLNQAADRVLRNKAGAKAPDEEDKRSSHLFQRHSDGKKFRKVDMASVTTSTPAPTKPSKINNVDLKIFVKAYAAAKEEKLNRDAEKSDLPDDGVDGEMDEMYVEAESTSVPIRGRKGSAKRATSSRISQILEFTEEEELQELYTDGTSGAQPLASEPDETYDDCENAVEANRQQQQQQLEDPDEIYEPLDEELPPEPRALESEPHPPPLPSSNLPEDKRNKDKENKEKEEAAKKREKAKEEKERKKKEEELKKLRRKFGLNDSDEKVGDGLVKNNASGGVFSKDLAVVKGEIVAILRMDGNPAGKWLVQNEHGKMGFVNSNNIEVATPTIRHLMAGVKTETGAPEVPQDTYEFLPEGEFDEIYEEL